MLRRHWPPATARRFLQGIGASDDTWIAPSVPLPPATVAGLAAFRSSEDFYEAVVEGSARTVVEDHCGDGGDASYLITLVALAGSGEEVRVVLPPPRSVRLRSSILTHVVCCCSSRFGACAALCRRRCDLSAGRAGGV
jgi:hypothetical protein